MYIDNIKLNQSRNYIDDLVDLIIRILKGEETKERHKIMMIAGSSMDMILSSVLSSLKIRKPKSKPLNMHINDTYDVISSIPSTYMIYDEIRNNRLNKFISSCEFWLTGFTTKILFTFYADNSLCKLTIIRNYIAYNILIVDLDGAYENDQMLNVKDNIDYITPFDTDVYAYTNGPGKTSDSRNVFKAQIDLIQRYCNNKRNVFLFDGTMLVLKANGLLEMI